ncbi:hypothetical protein [Vibrio mediterranei]|uniref:hypothetical protein n=1 Tax=Vibrio mediterranei TaxID=689 RepID=UPI00148CC6B7|nr:hypothetical protein [Vibrio mediterranei]NOH31248.1 hypothetical protein [Vibrio mediterranei]
MLRSRVLENLEKLDREALAVGKRLTQKRGSQNLCVIDAFDTPMDTRLAEYLSNRLRFKKKYNGLVPRTARELIVYMGGIKSSIKVLQSYQKCASLSEPKSYVDAVDDLEYLLVLAKGKTAQHGLRNTPNPLPFCALCWRRIDGSLHYCRQHHPSRSSKNHKLAKYKLMKAIERHSSVESIISQLKGYKEFKARDRLLSKKLYTWTSSFSPNPNRLIHIWKSIENSPLREQSEAIVEALKSIYPVATAKFRFPEVGEELDELSDWVLKVLADFDESEAYCWLTKDDNVWLDNATDIEIMMTFANMVSRLEATLTIDALPVPKNGPDKGYGANQDLRSKLEQLVAQQKSSGTKINQSAIARELGLSRQRVNVLIKETKLLAT